jgi:very-short-patch-repair endonuclease
MNAVRSFLQMARAQGKVGHVDSEIEATLAQQLRAAKVEPWERNYRALPDSKMEVDFAWPRLRLAIEVQGHVHRIKANFHRDIQKAARLQLEGWQLLAVDGLSIRSGQALVWALQFLRRRAELLEVRT